MKSKSLISSLLSIVVVAFVHTFIYPSMYNNEFGNIKYYCLISILFFAVFFGSMFLVDKLKVNYIKYEKNIYVVYSVLFFVWFVGMYFNEKYMYFYDKTNLRYRMPSILYLIILAIFSVGIYFFISKIHQIKGNQRIIRMTVIILFSSAQAIALAAPNILNDKNGTLYHMHAFFNPIYNAVDMRPLDNVIRSIYGHYPLLYILPTRILMVFGVSKLNAVMLVTCVLGFLSFMFLYFALDKLIKRDSLFYMSLLAMAHLSFYAYRSGQYYQVLPHRILFPCLAIYYISYFSEKTVSKPLICIISIFSIIWNFETGVACLISLLLFSLLKYIKDSNDKKKIIAQILLHSVLFVGSLLCAYIFVNVVNKSMGGGFLSVMDFIYPIADKGFKIEDWSVCLPDVYAFFYLIYAMFMLVLCAGVLKMAKKDLDKDLINIITICVLGLGILPYYMNRAAYGNLYIVHIEFVFSIALLVQRLFVKRIVVLSFSVLFAFYNLGTIVGIPKTFNNRINTSWNMKSYNVFCDLIKEYVPEDTPAAGPGLPDIYASLGWDPQIHIFEWDDWETNDAAVEYVINCFGTSDSLLIMDEVYNYIDPDEWILVNKTVDRFTYMVRKEDGVSKEEEILSIVEEMQLSPEEYINFVYLNYMNCYPDDITLNEYIKEVEDGSSGADDIINEIKELKEESQD